MKLLIDGNIAVKKLYMLADEFKVHMSNRDYSRAKACYDTASTVAVFLELKDSIRTELFGERGERGAILKQGLFREDQVIKAYEECCVKRNQGRENQEYRPVAKMGR